MIFLSGCASSQSQVQRPREDREAIKSVAGSIVGRPVSDEDFIKLEKEMKNNPDTKSAVETLERSMNAKPSIKYCPVDGARFASRVELCPEHNVRLKMVDE